MIALLAECAQNDLGTEAARLLKDWGWLLIVGLFWFLVSR